MKSSVTNFLLSEISPQSLPLWLFFIQGRLDECALDFLSSALTHSHKLQTQLLRCPPLQHKFSITGSFAAQLDLVKRSACWLFRNVKCYFSPPDLRLFQLVSRFNPENICWQAFSFIPRLLLAVIFPLLHTANSDFSVNLNLCVCNFWCWAVCIWNWTCKGMKVRKKTTEPDLVKYYLEHLVQCKQSVTSSWTAMILMLRRLWETGANTVSLQAPSGLALCSLSGWVPTSTIC